MKGGVSVVRDVKTREQLHEKNIRSVLAEIFNKQPIARIDIAKNLALNKSTVSALYGDLQEQGLVVELGEGQASTSGGRKPVMTAINNSFGYILNFDFGYRHLHTMLNSLSGEVLNYSQINVEGLSLKQIVPLVDDVILAAKKRDTTAHGLMGISFAIHGTVHSNQVTYSPFLKMDGIDLPKLFGDKYQVPVILENEANLAAVYERDFNDGRALKSMVTISIHRGIGAGIIVNKDLYRGAHGEAGEIGRSMFLERNSKHGVEKVEDYCSEEAIIAQLSALKGQNNLNRHTLVNLYKAEDEDAVKVLQRFEENIAIIISNVQNNYDPETIFLNSPLVEELPELLNSIHHNYKKLTKAEAVPLKLIDDSHSATLKGGSALVTRKVLGLDDFELSFTK